MRILIGYDGTPEAAKALRSLGRAGLPARASVLVFALVEPWARYDGMPKLGLPNWPGAAARAQYRRQLDQFLLAAKADAGKAAKALAKRFPAWRISAEAELDYPARGILVRAETWKADLIVIGSHGRGLLGRLVLGSVSEKVVRHAHCDVRIARLGSIVRAYAPRVLVCVDGSRRSLEAAEAAARRPWPAGTQVQIVGVLDPATLEGASTAIRSGFSENGPGAGIRNWLEGKINAAARRFRSRDVSLLKTILVGDPRQVILREAKSWKADSVFLGDSGLSGVERLLLGGVSAAVATVSGRSQRARV